MSFAIVYFPHTATADVVPASSIIGEHPVGSTTKVKWGRRTYTAKVLFTGPMEICEMKMTHVTAGGELIEDVFDIATVDEVPDTVQRDPSSSPTEREIVRRLTAVEERLACVADLLMRLERKIVLGEDQRNRMEGMLRQTVRRLPAPVEADGIEYTFATAELVAALRKANSDPKKFIRCLEEEVFKDEPHIMDIAVDQRHDSVDKMDFLRKCLFKFFDVPTNLREDMWKRAKASLNSRARRARKAQRDVGEGGQERSSGSGGTSNDAFDWDE